MTKPLVEINPLDGSVTEITYDETEDAIVEKTTVNVGPTIDYAKALQNHDETPEWLVQKNFRLAALIPPEVVELWHNEYGIDYWNPDHKPAIRRLLNSNEWQWLRTNNSRLRK
jgi:hypothetical protein